MMDFNGNNRGYAFVTFNTKQEAKTAMKQLNNYEIRFVVVMTSTPQPLGLTFTHQHSNLNKLGNTWNR